MKIGLVVDGLGEVAALPHLYARIRTTHILLKPVYERRLQPLAKPEQIAPIAARRCRLLAAEGAQLVVVLLDRETRVDCPGAFAARIEALIVRQLDRGIVRVAVVMKDRRFESWLVADLQCLARSPRLFADLSRVIQAVPSGNADGIDGAAVLHRAAGPRGSYHKVAGAKAICEHLDPGRAARNSRSFRRLMHILEDSRYANQSRLPHREDEG